MRGSGFGLLSLLAAIAALLVAPQFVGQASASPGHYRILMVRSSDGPVTTLKAQLAAFPDVSVVDDVTADDQPPPTAAQLEGYDMVVGVEDLPYQNLSGYGDALADYVDSGGVVLQYAYENYDGGTSGGHYGPAGRFVTGGYTPFVPGPATNHSRSLGTFDQANPLMQGVASLSADDDTTPTLASGATLVASWNDGGPAIAYKGRVVSVSAFPSDDAPSWGGDFARLTVNAVRWLGRQALTISRNGSGAGAVTSSPAGISCGAVCSGDYVDGTTVTLTASPGSGSTFAGWSGGGCSGTAACTVTMDAAKNVTATFNAIPILVQTPAFGGLTLSGKTLIVKNGKVTLTLTCPSASIGNCVGTDTLATASKVVAPRLTVAKKKKAKILTLGKGHFSIPAGKTAKVRIKLNKPALKLLTKKKTLNVKQTIVAHDSRNLPRKTNGSLKLKATKPKKKH